MKAGLEWCQYQNLPTVETNVVAALPTGRDTVALSTQLFSVISTSEKLVQVHERRATQHMADDIKSSVLTEMIKGASPQGTSHPERSETQRL
eukprot:4154527-Amphidinium_carterae.1